MEETPQPTTPAAGPDAPVAAGAERTVTHTVERKPGSTTVLSVEVAAARLDRATDRVFARRVRQARIPGFRPGKAPRALYERTYGSEHLWSEAAEDLVDETYREVIQAEGLEPLDTPSVEISQLEAGKPLVYTATMPVRPGVAIGDHRAHGQTIELAPLSDDEVTKTIDAMRERHAVLRPVERAAARGDVVTVDVDLSLDGGAAQPFGRDAHLEIGRTYALPGLAEGLDGASAGEERSLALPFPDDYGDEPLRGKTGAFSVKVKAVAEKVMPALDDEFAKTVGVADLAALDRAVRGELLHAGFHDARDAAADKMMDHLLAVSTVELPEVLVQDELDHLVAELQARVKEQGLPWEQFLLQARKTEDEIRAEWRPAAERRAKSLLVLDDLAKREGITVSGEELAAEAATTPLGQQDARALRDPRVLAALARSLRNRKLVDKLLGLEGPASEREILKRAGAPDVDLHRGGEPEAPAESALIVPAAPAESALIMPAAAKPETSAEGREALRRMRDP